MKAFGFAGWSGAGKTTLIEKLLMHYAARGLRVSLIKHAHHSFDVDQPGKDSWRHRRAGAYEVLIGSSERWALMHELRGAAEPTLEQQLQRFSACDLVLVEGYKRAALPKLEIHRPALGKPLLAPGDPSIVGVAGDLPPAEASRSARPWFDLNDVDRIAAFILDQLKVDEPSRPT